MELVSVVVPVYKVEQYLERCVKSICEQTYQELEIILVMMDRRIVAVKCVKSWLKRIIEFKCCINRMVD